ncbi:hypothetical protein [Goodfellowiella coeruleoviolacea]|uniref:Uncharacterized protein n=1 Tax=Goodfellowiella coeruleoviolacea TaxID=334858 RepID=A0AAE3KL49_9PSEU|nr:hypothetical protein [Goodfellowiella coeruleoviolacea]MCP2170014.1 hypothetical protein [Goodfellowiella coeruleoviolacea]
MGDDNGVLRSMEGADAYAGAGPADTIAQTVDSIKNFDDPSDALEVGMNVAATGIDILGTVVDPLGTLASSAVGWLIEHVSFLREPFDLLAGNPDDIKAAVATFNDCADKLNQISTAQTEALSSQVQNWPKDVSAASAAFHEKMTFRAEQLKGASMACIGVAESIAHAGTWTGVVRGLIRDLIATFVGEVIRNALIALASSWFTLGGSVAAFTAWAVGRGAMVLSKCTAKIAKLLEALSRLGHRVKGLANDIGDLLKRMTGGTPTPRTAGPSLPNALDRGAQNMRNATTNLENFANARADKLSEAGTKLRQAGNEFRTGWNNAGNTVDNMDRGWETWRNANLPGPLNRAADWADNNISPGYGITGRNPGANFSHPELGGVGGKTAADLAREYNKYDDLSSEVPDGGSQQAQDAQKERVGKLSDQKDQWDKEHSGRPSNWWSQSGTL